jgi:osmotically-inducible protein OsmY
MQENHVLEKIKFCAPTKFESSDEELANRARSLLRWKIRYDSIRVKTVNGHVTLFGEVSWDLDRDTAERTVRKLPGVVDVTNSIVTTTHVIRNAEKLRSRL